VKPAILILPTYKLVRIKFIDLKLGTLMKRVFSDIAMRIMMEFV
jgi:hypothetical protein